MEIEDNNKISRDDEAVARLVGTLKRVEPPKDFDFKVKARIAHGQPAPLRTSWFPTPVRIAVPLGLALLVGGYAGYSALKPSQVIENTPVAAANRVSETQAVVRQEPAPVVVQPTVEPVVKQVETATIEPKAQIKAGQPSQPQAVRKRPSTGGSYDEPSTTKGAGGGSYDAAQGVTKPIAPRGLNGEGKVPAKEMLNILGIDARFDGSGWRVNSAAANSIAERSGVKAGDVIEAVNGQNLVENTSFGDRFTGKNLRVRRDGKSIQIEVKP